MLQPNSRSDGVLGSITVLAHAQLQHKQCVLHKLQTVTTSWLSAQTKGVRTHLHKAKLAHLLLCCGVMKQVLYTHLADVKTCSAADIEQLKNQFLLKASH